MKKSRIIAPALGVLILSTAASITGTVAWFTANNSVTINGMQLKTKVGSNLLISADTTEANFGSGPLGQTKRGILEPVSSINGTVFYYTNNAKGDGSPVANASDDYVLYNPETAATVNDYNDAFSQAYDVTKTEAATLFPAVVSPAIAAEQGARAYVDYEFYLKATSTSNDQKVSLKIARLLYGGDICNEKAWRVAFFTNPGQTTAALAGSTATSLLSILSPAGALYYDSNKAAAGVEIASRAAVSNLNTAVTIESDLDAGLTKYYKVVARLWLEGEDTTCTNDTFAKLTNTWTLDLEFELGANTGATSIKNSSVDVALSNSNKTATASLNDATLSASTYVWKNAATKTAIDGATSAVFTNAGEAVDVYCEITDSGSNVHTSEVVSLAAGA